MEHKITKGDAIRCFNSEAGFVEGFNWNTWCLKLAIGSYKTETHLMNVRAVNGMEVEPTICKLIYEGE